MRIGQDFWWVTGTWLTWHTVYVDTQFTLAHSLHHRWCHWLVTGHLIVICHSWKLFEPSLWHMSEFELLLVMYKVYCQFSAHVHSTAHRLHSHYTPMVFLVVRAKVLLSPLFRASLVRSGRQWPPCPITSLFGRGMRQSQRPTLWLKGCQGRTTQHTTCDQVGSSTIECWVGGVTASCSFIHHVETNMCISVSGTVHCSGAFDSWFTQWFKITCVVCF